MDGLKGPHILVASSKETITGNTSSLYEKLALLSAVVLGEGSKTIFELG
jgi:hypothetical protein